MLRKAESLKMALTAPVAGAAPAYLLMVGGLPSTPPPSFEQPPHGRPGGILKYTDNFYSGSFIIKTSIL